MAFARSGVIFGRPNFRVEETTVKKDLIQDKPQMSDLDQMVEKSGKIIYKTSSVYPFDFFPNIITICPNRITITHKEFMMRTEFPLQIESITGANIGQGWVFATLHIDTFGVKDPPPPINYLRKPEARLARRYILALIECKKSNIDLNKYSVEELRDKLLKIGRVREGDTPDELVLTS